MHCTTLEMKSVYYQDFKVTRRILNGNGFGSRKHLVSFSSLADLAAPHLLHAIEKVLYSYILKASQLARLI